MGEVDDLETQHLWPRLSTEVRLKRYCWLNNKTSCLSNILLVLQLTMVRHTGPHMYLGTDFIITWNVCAAGGEINLSQDNIREGKGNVLWMHVWSSGALTSPDPPQLTQKKRWARDRNSARAVYTCRLLFIDLPWSALCAKVSLMVTPNCWAGLKLISCNKAVSAEPSRDSRMRVYYRQKTESYDIVLWKSCLLKRQQDAVASELKPNCMQCRLCLMTLVYMGKTSESSLSDSQALMHHSDTKDVRCRRSKDPTCSNNVGKEDVGVA